MKPVEADSLNKPDIDTQVQRRVEKTKETKATRSMTEIRLERRKSMKDRVEHFREYEILKFSITRQLMI